MEDDGIASWDAVAPDWDRFAETNDYRIFFLIPVTLELLGDVTGKRILDLGCGEGGYARILARRGAEVTAVDASPKMIAIAREKADREGLTITHLVNDAAALDGINDNWHDIVLAATSLMDVERYELAVEEIRRVLKPGGTLLMSILHPCFTGRWTRWVKDEEGNFLHLVVDNYFDKTPWKEFIRPDMFDHEVVFRHMPLQDYMNPLLQVGLRLVKFHEPVPTAEQMQKSPRLPELRRIPLFLFMEWQKEGRCQ